MIEKKDILYPIFLECCQFTTDNYWENIFQELAYGKTPYGSYISKDYLCCNYKNKEFIYKIEVKDPEIIYEEVYNLLFNKLGLQSYQQKIQKRSDFNDIEDNIRNSRNSWNTIRKKNIKDLLIEKYIIEMKSKYSLSTSQCKNLMSTIFVALMFKVITAKDIVYKDGIITNIYGITFSNQTVHINRNIFVPTSNINTDIIFDKMSICDTWEKYINDLVKKFNITLK